MRNFAYRAMPALAMCMALSAQAMSQAAAAPAVAPSASAYPNRSVTIVVPFPPGGTNDILGRILAQHLQADLHQSFLVENRGGAGGVIGSAWVARAAPDGYTLLLSSSGPMATALAVYKDQVPYSVTRDFAAVATVADVTIAVVTNTNFPARSIADVIRIAKAKPGTVRVALPAVGSMHHLLTALFAQRAGIELNLIPYKGTAPAVIDLIGGQVDLDFDNMPALIEQIKAGKLRALATPTSKRSALLPDTPTFKELGFNDLDAAPWFVLVAPAGTPESIVGKLNAEVKRIIEDPAMKKTLAQQGANPAWRNESGTREFLASEVARWTQVVKETGAKVE